MIGAHVSIRGGLHRAIERGESLSCEAIQIFTKNQLQWKSPPLKLEHSIVFYKKWQESYVKDIVAHASYLINLASEGDLRFKSISAAVDEVSRCRELGIGCLVLHPGSHGGVGLEKGLMRMADALKEILARTDDAKTKILLETTAGEGFSLGGIYLILELCSSCWMAIQGLAFALILVICLRADMSWHLVKVTSVFFQ